MASDIFAGCRTNRCTAGGYQKVAGGNLAICTTRTLENSRVSAPEARVRPGSRVPAVADLRDTRRGDADLRRSRVGHRNIEIHSRPGAADVETHVAVLPRRVACHRQATRVAVVDETFLRILKGDAVLDDVVCGRVVCDAELEAVAISVEVAEGPAVYTIAPCIHLLEEDGRAKHEEIQPVINVVPETRISEDVALTGTAFASEAIGRLAVFPWIAVAIGVEVLHGIVRGCTFELKASLIIIMGCDQLVVVVRGVSGVDAVRAIDEPARCSESLFVYM